MSIVLMIKQSNQRETCIPIATESFFKRCWIGIARKNELQYILSMQSGYSFDNISIVYIIRELRQMVDNIPTANLDTDELHFLNERLVYIITQLEQFTAKPGSHFEGYVG